MITIALCILCKVKHVNNTIDLIQNAFTIGVRNLIEIILNHRISLETNTLNGFFGFTLALQEGEVYVTSDCSLRCNCSEGHLVCDYDYHCSPNTVCAERDGLRQCYCNPGYEGDGVLCPPTTTATDCLDVFNDGNTDSGVYNISPTGWSGLPFKVYCNMTDGGGWTVSNRPTVFLRSIPLR